MGRYAEQYLDTGLELDMAWTHELEAEQQRERLVRLAVMAMHAGQMPRRLGGDATPLELRADKRAHRQVLARLTSVYRLWGGQPADITERYHRELENEGSELISAAAQVDWEQWWAANKPKHQEHARRIATHALKLTDRKTANRLIHRLEVEWYTLDDILGVLPEADQ